MITNFPEKPTYNSGGLKKFFFVPFLGVSENPVVVAGSAVTPLGLFPGFSLLAGYATIHTLQFIEEQNENEHGIFYEQTLTGFAPSDTQEMMDLFTEMAQNRFLIMTSDYLGKKRLVGSSDNPLAFSYKFSTGNDRKDSRGYKFSFSGISTKAALDYPF